MIDSSIAANTDASDRLDQPGFADAGDDRPTPKVSDPSIEGDNVDPAAIMNALRGVIDPELGDNLVVLGTVKRLGRTRPTLTVESAHSRHCKTFSRNRATTRTPAHNTLPERRKVQRHHSNEAGFISAVDTDVTSKRLSEATIQAILANINEPEWPFADSTARTSHSGPERAIEPAEERRAE